jgi:hypothetical protein
LLWNNDFCRMRNPVLLLALLFAVPVLMHPASGSGFAPDGNGSVPENREGRVRGLVVHAADSTALGSVHVINLSRERGTASAENGSFAIAASEGDQIMFQSVGFTNDTITVSLGDMDPGRILLVRLQPRTYELSAVDVFPYATFAEFKHAFLHFKDPEPEFDLHLPELPYIPPADGSGGVVISGPITYLYDRFSKRGREWTRYQEVLESESLALQAVRIVNPDLVRRYTELEDEEEIREFLDYCKLSDEFIVRSPRHAVYEALLACYRDYMAMRTP